MLDALYPPRANIATPTDDTIVCRCEELTAGDIRKAAAIGQPGPNQLKAYTRAGMGPCKAVNAATPSRTSLPRSKAERSPRWGFIASGRRSSR